MIPRGTIIAALLAIELAIVGEAAVAVRGGGPSPSASQRHAGDGPVSGPNLAEDGSHRTFAVGAHPSLSIDIGYADLTILTGKAAQIDVAVNPSSDFGFFRAKKPITARADGQTVHVAATRGDDWSIGDDRMVTVVVPPETLVTVVNAGDIKASGLRAEASFHSLGFGSIEISDFDAAVLHAASFHGRISLHGVVASIIDATSRDGHVEGSALRLHDGTIESGGRVTLEFAPGSDTVVTARTNDGHVTASGFASGAASAPTNDSDDDDSVMRTVRVGSGIGRLDVHSDDGNITLVQQG